MWHFLLAVFLRGVAFLEGVFSVMEGCDIFGKCFGGGDILEEALAEFWRGVAILEGTCSVMEGCFQCFGGVWHFWRALVVFWRGVAFFEGCLQCFGGT